MYERHNRLPTSIPDIDTSINQQLTVPTCFLSRKLKFPTIDTPVSRYGHWRFSIGKLASPRK